MAEILSSIRVLDLTRFIAGPTCTMSLADLGATIYKVERPGTGDEIRAVGPFPKPDDPDQRGATRDSGAYLSWNRGKQSITVNIATPEGAQLLRDLAAKCDVLVENYKVGDLKRYGLDYASISKINPGIVYCSVTGYGQDGPDATKAAFDGAMQGRAGLMSVAGPAEGQPGSAPMRTPVNLIDVSTGLFATIAILGALWHRRDTGEGQYIDTTLLDTAVFLNSQFSLGYMLNGNVTQRAGNRNPGSAPSEVFKTKDGNILFICSSDPLWISFCKIINRPDWSSDERFKSNQDRVKNGDVLYPMLNELFLTRTTAEWNSLIENAGIPGGPINDIRQVFNDAQVKHRGIEMHLKRPNGQTVPVIRSPLHLSKTPVEHVAPPTIGEHTDRILHEVLGKSEAEIAQLRAAKAI